MEAANLQDAYRGRRVLVTGDTGFKGSWLCAWLLELGAEITGFALPPDSPSHYELLQLRDDIKHVDGDLRDAQAVRRVLAASEPEVVFHLGAQALVRDSYVDPVSTFATNVLGTVHVLDAIRDTSSVLAAVVVTSDKCYENNEYVWAYRENDPVGGHDPYSASKGAAELVISSYRRSFFGGARPHLGVASARAGNVIGGGDWARDRLVPDCARTLLEGKVLTLRNPRAVRPWQHVLEPLGGYLVLGARLLRDPQRYATAYNFGPHDHSALDVEGIAQSFREAFRTGEITSMVDVNSPHEASSLRLACERAHVELGWRAVLSTPDAVNWTARWYRTFRADPRAARDVSFSQLRDYVRALALAEVIK